MFLYICTYVNMYTYMYIYIYIYTYIYMYIYTSPHDLIQYDLNMHTDTDIARESTPDSDTLEEAAQVSIRGQGVCCKV